MAEHAMTGQDAAQRAEEWAREWVAYADESLADLLVRFSIHETAIWRRDYGDAAVAEAVKERNQAIDYSMYLDRCIDDLVAKLTEARREERRATAESLSAAWQRYRALFEEVPHGTVKQMAALLELIPASAPEREK